MVTRSVTRSIVTGALAVVLVAACAEPNPTAGVVARPPASTGDVVFVASEPPTVDPSGTIVVGGVAHAVAGRSVVMTESGGRPGDGDFGICTLDVPTDPGSLAIVVAVDADEFAFRVVGGAPELRYGESLVSEDVTRDVDYRSDGSRVVGSATLPQAGLVEFDIDCP